MGARDGFRLATHGATAAVRRADANVTRKREAREWDERHGKLVDLSAFQHEIRPLIQPIPPRHRQAFLEVTRSQC